MVELVVWLVLVVLLFLVFFFFGGRFWMSARKLITNEAKFYWEKQLPQLIQEKLDQQIPAQLKGNFGQKDREFISRQDFQKELADIIRRLTALEQKQTDSAPNQPTALAPDPSTIIREAIQQVPTEKIPPSPSWIPNTEPEPDKGTTPNMEISPPSREKFFPNLESLKEFIRSKGENGQQLFQELQEKGFNITKPEKLYFLNRLFQMATVGEQRDKSIKHICEQLFDFNVEYPPLGDRIPPSMTNSVNINYRQYLSQNPDLLHTIELYWQSNEISAGKVCYVLKPIVMEQGRNNLLQKGVLVLY
jgi:hypothetical protein